MTDGRGRVDAGTMGPAISSASIVVGRHLVDSIPRLVGGSIGTSVLEHAHTTVAVVPEAEPA